MSRLGGVFEHLSVLTRKSRLSESHNNVGASIPPVWRVTFNREGRITGKIKSWLPQHISVGWVTSNPHPSAKMGWISFAKPPSLYGRAWGRVFCLGFKATLLFYWPLNLNKPLKFMWCNLFRLSTPLIVLML